jgi:putative flavoprotein involved in K+ transport
MPERVETIVVGGGRAGLAVSYCLSRQGRDHVKLPVVDGDGYPIQKRGVTNYPGLYFVGMPCICNGRSGLLYGAEQDASYVAERIVADERLVVPADPTDLPPDSWISHDFCSS